VELLLDTGASINVLNKRTFEKLNQKRKTPLQLSTSNTRLVTYGNDTPNLKVKGEVVLLIESKKKFIN